ncbi:hypothetical protein [Rhizobium sp. OAE497]|uniref:hypothetical protein n=1 Tax=Rhizobium sp. OAE497 TaxID=2663796 RepID=UPI0018F486E6
MSYEELRSLVKRHFQQQLTKAKDRIMNQGRLSVEDRQGYEGAVSQAQSAIDINEPLSLLETDDEVLTRFIGKYELDIQAASPRYRQLLDLLRIALRDYSKAVLDFDGQLDTIEFGQPTAPVTVTHNEREAASTLSLRELVDAYTGEETCRSLGFENRNGKGRLLGLTHGNSRRRSTRR